MPAPPKISGKMIKVSKVFRHPLFHQHLFPFRPYIENVHLKDWELSPDEKGILCRNGKYIRGGSHGKGLMDQQELLMALKKDGYSNYLAFEYEGILDHEEETRKGFQYLKHLSEN